MTTTHETKQAKSSTVLLVTPPQCMGAVEGMYFVESARCQTVEVKQPHQLEMLQESKFGATDSEEQELEERPILISKKKTANVGGYDACQEYGYKYEYAQGDELSDQQKEDGEDDDSSSNPLFGESTDGITNFALHLATSFIVKSTNERIPYIYMLGRTYHPVHEYQVRKSYEKSLFWFTYRCDFPEIAPYKITSDAGWGCMLRSAQMLLGHTLRIHFQSRHWKPPMAPEKCRKDPLVRNLLSWFADYPSKNESVYSLHNMVAAGYAKYETLPGEWYGPSKACYVVRDLVDLHHNLQPSLFRVHVSSEGTVYKKPVHILMTTDSRRRAEERQRQDDEKSAQVVPLHPLDPSIPASTTPDPESLDWDTSLLLLVPLRLGLDRFNEDYVQGLARSFWLPQSVGILGGRPRSARWFYGAYADGTKVLGLDPHTIQNAPRRKNSKPSMVDLSDEYLQSVHSPFPDIYPLNRMDPSIAMGFYCRDKNEFEQLEASLQELRKSQPSAPALFTFEDQAPDYLSAMNDMLLGDLDIDETERAEEESDEDEYVML